MTILVKSQILIENIITPFVEKTVTTVGGGIEISRGASPAGYDLALAYVDNDEWFIDPGGFKLVSALEYFNMPLNVMGVVHDKSTWARMGLAVQNTVIEPGWQGCLTLEITNHSKERIPLYYGVGICQVIFHRLERWAKQGYDGKYQHQGVLPQGAK